MFFTQLQLPDWSYEKMSQQALSGESRKQMFIDAQLKVKDESGRLIEFFDREMNVIKAFLKIMLGDAYAADIDSLKVDMVITPFTITDEKDTIPYLPPLDLLPFAPRYMPNAPVNTLHPSFQTPQTAFHALYFAQNPNTRFVPKFATSNDGFRVCQALLTLLS